MQAACHGTGDTVIADYDADYGGFSEQTERSESLVLLIFLT
jgi:hypothetical protein